MSVNKIKARYWAGVLYLENMIEDWAVQIGDLVGYPYAYCIHDKDKDSSGDLRKAHMHLLIAFPNTTTYNFAFRIFSKLNAEGKKAINKVEDVASVRGAYDYLIHATESARKAGKFLYEKSERVTGNNFDIGDYEQISLSRRKEVKSILRKVIFAQKFMYYDEFCDFVERYFTDDGVFLEVAQDNTLYFSKLCDCNRDRFKNARTLDTWVQGSPLRNDLEKAQDAPEGSDSV